MNRRKALTWFAVAAAGGGASWFGARALRSEWGSHLTPLEAALSAARVNGKPVLVFVAPDFPGSQSDLGRALGNLFEFSNEDIFEDFALCEMVCATRQQIFESIAVETTPNKVGRIEFHGPRATWTEIAFDANPLPMAVLEKSEIDERVASNSRGLRAAIVPDAESLSRRADEARRALGPEWTRDFTLRLDSGLSIEPAELDSGAALVRQHASWPALRLGLIHAARERLMTGSPNGARWVQDFGCGDSLVGFRADDGRVARRDLERRARGDPPLSHSPPGDVVGEFLREDMGGILCGMAFSSVVGSRFLLFYTDES